MRKNEIVVLKTRRHCAAVVYKVLPSVAALLLGLIKYKEAQLNIFGVL
jgi:hypothetical protein